MLFVVLFETYINITYLLNIYVTNYTSLEYVVSKCCVLPHEMVLVCSFDFGQAESFGYDGSYSRSIAVQYLEGR